MTETVAEKEIRCVLIPLTEFWMLLPNAAVAEVISFTSYKKQDNQIDWMLGTIDWREQKVPLVSFEGLLETPIQQITERTKIVILNTLNGNTRLPYIAIVSQSIPRLIKVSSETLKVMPGASKMKKSAVSEWTRVNDYLSLIPSLDFLEKSVYKIIYKSK